MFRSLLPFISVIILGFINTKVFSGPPFKTDDPQPVDYLHWEFYIASAQQFEKHKTSATCPHFEINYGIIPNAQFHLVAPLGYVHAENGVHIGYADTEVGIKYRFIAETAGRPQVGVFPLAELPTGNDNKQLGSGKIQVYLPVWAQKSWEKITTYAGGGLWYNPVAGQKNWFFSGWEIQYDFSPVLTLGGELYYQTAESDDGDPDYGFSIGGFLNVNKSNHILLSFGWSLSTPASINGYIGYQLTI